MRIDKELNTYLQVLWRSKWTIIACAIVAFAVALGISYKLTPLYLATATVRVASAPGGASDYLYSSSATRLSNTYVEIATSDVSLNKVAERLGLDEKPKVEVEVVPETELLKINSTDSDPSRARDIVNALADLLVEQSMQLYGGDAPTAREILEGQLKQAKADLDAAVTEYDKALRVNTNNTTPTVSGTPLSVPDIDNLERLVGFRQQIYNGLLSEFQNTNNLDQKNALQEQMKQAKIDLDNAIKEYDNAIHTFQSEESLPVNATPTPNPQLEVLANLISVRQQIYGDMLQKYQETYTSEQLRTNAITIVELAELPQKPSTPNIPLNAVLGLASGLVTGVILAFLIEALDDTIRDIEDVQLITKLPILCKVPRLNGKFRSKPKLPLPLNDQFSLVTSLEQLRVHLMLFERHPKITTFLITSPEPGAGKSVIIANLAVTLAQGGNSVVLADMDFRRPRQHNLFGLPLGKGLSDFIRGAMKLEETLKKTNWPNLQVITAGSDLHGMNEWSTPSHVSELLDTLGKLSDFLLIDAPALLSVADPMALASQSGAVILVVAQRETDRQNLRFALQQLINLKANIAGIVFNKVPNSQIYSYYSESVVRFNPQHNRKII